MYSSALFLRLMFALESLLATELTLWGTNKQNNEGCDYGTLNAGAGLRRPRGWRGARDSARAAVREPSPCQGMHGFVGRQYEWLDSSGRSIPMSPRPERSKTESRNKNDRDG